MTFRVVYKLDRKPRLCGTPFSPRFRFEAISSLSSFASLAWGTTVGRRHAEKGEER